MTQPEAIEIRWRQPDELQPWEFNRQTFAQLDAAAFAKLVTDIRARGVQVPVTVDPQGRVICGTERTRACQSLGQSVPTRVVRLNNELDYQEYAVRDNLERRHLSPTDQARLLVKLQEIEQQRRRAASPQPNGAAPAQASKVRDAVGAQVGLSGRQAVKYMRAARLPAPVRQLLDRHEISLDVAEVLATRGKSRPDEEIVAIAKHAAEQGLSRAQVAKALRAPRRKAGRSRADVPPLPPQKMNGLLMGLGAVIELEDVAPESVASACTSRAELMELGRLLGRAHVVVVKLRKAVDQALLRYNGGTN